jgi:hypothetical protein
MNLCQEAKLILNQQQDLSSRILQQVGVLN